MSEERLDLSLYMDRSPLPQASDAYYRFVKGLISPLGNDKIAVFNSITTIDLREDAPLYNDFQIRVFADRVISQSPLGFTDGADTSARYSQSYKDLIILLTAKIDVSLSKEIRDEVRELEKDAQNSQNEMSDYLLSIQEGWKRESIALGLGSPDDRTRSDEMQKEYDLRRVLFLQQMQYERRYMSLKRKITNAYVRIDQLRLSANSDQESRLLYQNLNDLEVQFTRPRDPRTEKNYQLDNVKIQDPMFKEMRDVFDVGLALQSGSDPTVVFAGAGYRDFTVKTTDDLTDQHLNDWGISVSGANWGWISASISTSDTSNFKRSLNNVREIKMGFNYIAELPIVRVDWFKPSIFSGSKVKDYLQSNSGLRNSLKNVVTSVIIGRGLTLSLKFSSVEDVRAWGETKSQGGFSILGVPFGTQADQSSPWERKQINTADQSVIFSDGDKVCRVLGLRIDAAY